MWYSALVSKHQKAGVYVVISILGLPVADCTRRVPLSSTRNDWSILGGGRSAQDCSLRRQISSATGSSTGGISPVKSAILKLAINGLGGHQSRFPPSRLRASHTPGVRLRNS